MAACSGSPGGPTAPKPGLGSAVSSTSATPASTGGAGQAVLRTVDPMELPGAVHATQVQTETRSTWQPRVHITWPLTVRAPGLLDALRTMAAAKAVAFTRDFGKGATKAELTGTWQLLADGASVQGARLVLTEFAGASTGASSHTWYAPVGKAHRVWRSSELVVPAAADRLLALAQAANREAGWGELDVVGITADDVLGDLTFTPDGGLRLIADKGVLAGADHGMVALEVDRATTDALLSDAGRSVRAALAEPLWTSAPPVQPTPAAVPGVDCQVKKCIALTFDDGPGPLTAGIVDVLVKHHARATFFVLGPAAQSSLGLLKRMHEQGMAIGDHTWTHSQLSRLGAAQATREITSTAEVVELATGVRPVAVRPPYGAFTKQTPHAGYAFVLWDVDTEDWKNRNTATTTQRALTGAHRGAIILMHDIHSSTAKAVETIVTKLQAQGYTLVTVPEVTGGLVAGQDYYRGR